MIFSRRSVRKMLDTLSANLEPNRLRDLEGKLASESDQTRGAEWEVAIGYALSQVGQLKDFGNTKQGNPDFIWSIDGTQVIVEVTSVSDASFHDLNPVEDFFKEFRRIISKNRISESGWFSYDFGSIDQEDKVLLGIPDKKHIATFFQSEGFIKFISEIKSFPEKENNFQFNVRGSISHISYIPGKGYFTGGYRSYSVPLTYRHSPIFNCLQAKEKQLRKSKVSDPAILVICDNDCDALRPGFGVVGRVSMRDIVGLFLNGQQKKESGNFIWQEGVPAQGSRIHAVVWISVHEVLSVPFGIGKNIKLNADIEFASYADPLIKNIQFINSLNRVFETLPTPLCTPRNASIKHKRSPFYGGYQLSGNQIKFSALTLQKLLTGEISQKEFQRDHSDMVEYLKTLTNQGFMISGVEIGITENDDDWILIDFNNLNPEKIFRRY